MLSDQLSADLKQAMLNRDATVVSVLRMLQAELKNAAIAKQAPLDEPETLGVIRKEVKKRKDAAEAYTSAGSADRAAAEEGEAAILSRYLPAAADEASVRAFLQEEVAKLGTLEPRHRGELIRSAMAQFAGALDGQTASRLVGELF